MTTRAASSARWYDPPIAAILLCAYVDDAFVLRTARKCAPLQVPVDASASEVIGAPREEIVAAEPETSAASEHPPHEVSRRREIASVAWPDTFESSPMDSDVSGGHV